MNSELIARLKAETPLWFKKIRKFSAGVVTLAITLIGLSTNVPGFALPALAQTICTYVIIAGVTAGLVSTTAKVDKP